MGWERRQRGGRYFTRSIRINGRVRRLYLGAGPFAESVAALYAEHDARRKALAEHRARVLQLESEIDELDHICDDLICASLEQAGFHQHRGLWRRRRG